jgi:hypothetical protein
MCGRLTAEKGVRPMERVFYSAESLRTALAAFEQEYETSSPKFYAAYLAGERLSVPHFEQHVWASFYEDVLRMERSARVDVRRVADHL